MYDPGIGLPPCLATSILTAEGIPFSCEGDLGNAISMLILEHLTGGAAFAETYMIDYSKKHLLLGHCGQGNLSFAQNSCRVCIREHPAFTDSPVKGASMNFSYRKGCATLLNISTDSGCRFKMVISTGKLSPYDPSDLGVPQGWYDPGMDIDTFVEKWLSAGPSHHAALGYGNVTSILEKAADMLDMNLYVI
jgi:L-arabinose isomerase